MMNDQINRQPSRNGRLSVAFAWGTVVAGCLCAWVPATFGATASGVRFNRDIRPILSENCFACHGPDANKRKAKLRLDTKEGPYEKAPSRDPAVIPGSLDQSELWRRITTTNVDDVMPPPESHKTLKAEQKELVRRWILAGAPWEGHWAYLRPERPPVPDVTRLRAGPATFKVRNPIDAFVLAKLQSKGLHPAPEADRRTLARRVALDLTGLPPTAEEVAAFVRDTSPDAYARRVHKLMASAHWGEHRARYWLDAARYADTHGLHFDNYREIWPYRDWVINAFNRNLPFDRFTLEQLAGDLLADATDDERVATGFERCNMTTNEGGTIEDENLANYANDRVTTTAWVWLGTTMNCCACHDHKFDPFTTRDFYSMAAFFRNTKQGGFDKNWRESDLYMVVPQTDSDRARWKALPGEISGAAEAREAQAREAEAAFTNWLANVAPDAASATIALRDEYLRLPLTDVDAGTHGDCTQAPGALAGTSARFDVTGRFDWLTNGPLGNAPVFTKTNSVAIGDAGNFEANEPFSFGAWVRLTNDFKGEGSVLARMEPEDRKFRGWELFVKDEDFGARFVHRWSPMAMKINSIERAVKRGEWQHLFVTYDGSGRAKGVKLFVNGAEVKANRDQDGLEGSIRAACALRIGRRERGNELDQVAVQDVRLVRRRLASAEVRALAVAPRLQDWLGQIQREPTNAVAREALRDYFLVTQHSGWQNAAARLAALESEQEAIRGRSPVTLIQQEKKNSEPMAQILFRGQYDKPKEKVGPATPATLPPMPSGAPRNRLGLAEWIIAPENPLTARVTVNRFWAEVFGVGLVKNAEDFGTTSEPPVNQDLLDWLAVEFVESGWDVRHLFELMVTSSAYRQSSETTPEKLEKDPQNRLLSRGPRFRMDAEMIRDYALATSGLLEEKIGGPSVRPYQPDGVWEAVAMPESNTRYYERQSGSALYRRSLYTFWKRAAPPATMDIFNAPSREVCTVRRERTDTPLQALATLNDPQFVEAARRLAELALQRARRPEEALDFIAGRLLTRSLTAKERAIVTHTLQQMQAFYQQHPDAAGQLIATGESKPSDAIPAPQLAALTMVANQLLNLDEVLCK